ncbi:LPS O-antigen chain length determinant protein, WzzB/FepE family [Chitinophaga jiangningensis]|uniref:LPS O-antigen chain length determinant protein, WzzB/FepE family n=1 Tax=Chitinophaga jiangningensis TaxID=1419482 RepID=A0A1M7HJ39_9BACT|nr:hypothetical protein [Chitinophaga jiangningensis]SHM28541.1 LPS O-antigen chain length determinant protein, WzzB/FepE family [Chitinophaga jiangningensis]
MQAPGQSQSSASEKQISLKDILIQLFAAIGFLWAKKWILVIAVIFGSALGFVYSLVAKTKYVANLSFVMEETKGSGLGAYAGIASQFGIDLSGGASSGLFSGDNILEFLKTNLIVERALLSPRTGNLKGTESLADLYVESHDWKKQWSKDPGLSDIKFSRENDYSSDPRKKLQRDSLLKVLYQDILKNVLAVGKPDKKLGFIVVTCISRNEEFSQKFATRVVGEAIEFYSKMKTKKSAANVAVLQAKADSIAALMNKKTYAAAVEADLNANPARRVTLVGAELASRDKLMLQTMYGEVVKNLELSKIAMSQDAPLIQEVDVPQLPLEKVKVRKSMGLLLGGIIGGSLVAVLLLAIRFYKSIFAD